MTMHDLIMGVLARVGKLPPNGITIYDAASSIQSLINARLMDRRSDLAATGDLDLVIPAYGYSATLPEGFIAPAEKPKAYELYTDWMAGTVTSYDPATGALVMNILNCDGADTLASWTICTIGLPGNPAVVIGTSATSLTVGTGEKSLTTQTGLPVSAGAYLVMVSSVLPDAVPGFKLDPYYLDDDPDYDDASQPYGADEAADRHPRRYKIIGNMIYVRPKLTVANSIKGRFYARPPRFSLPSSVIPWNGLFDEIFRGGTVMVIARGLEMLEADEAFMAFFTREFNSVISARQRLVPDKRMNRSNWI